MVRIRPSICLFVGLCLVIISFAKSQYRSGLRKGKRVNLTEVENQFRDCYIEIIYREDESQEISQNEEVPAVHDARRNPNAQEVVQQHCFLIVVISNDGKTALEFLKSLEKEWIRNQDSFMAVIIITADFATTAGGRYFRKWQTRNLFKSFQLIIFDKSDFSGHDLTKEPITALIVQHSRQTYFSKKYNPVVLKIEFNRLTRRKIETNQEIFRTEEFVTSKFQCDRFTGADTIEFQNKGSDSTAFEERKESCLKELCLLFQRRFNTSFFSTVKNNGTYTTIPKTIPKKVVKRDVQSVLIENSDNPKIVTTSKKRKAHLLRTVASPLKPAPHIYELFACSVALLWNIYFFIYTFYIIIRF